jgi:tRNA A-37 threonylcarbamoyl transferase component Bud32
MSGGEQPNGGGGMPSEIGGYRIQRVLGSGGMATVYAALQQQPRRTVALKVMRGVGAGGGEASLRRFKREIEILGRLNHPYIAQVYAAGVHEDVGGAVPYFVMEYVPGGKTLLEYAVAKQLSLRDRLKLFVKVCAAVEHGHQRRIIHRDLKPGNILIDEQGEPRIIDYGVAHAVELDAAMATMAADAGRLVGTIQYMAPEQLEAAGADLDARCDVYALGAVFYKLLTGKSMHDMKGLPVLTAVQIVKEESPQRPSALAPDIKGDLETIVLTAIAKDKMRRYRSAGALGRDVIRYLANKPIKARRASRLHRSRLFVRRHRTELVAAFIVIIVVLGAAGVIWWRLGERNGDAPGAARADNAAAPTQPAASDGDPRRPMLLRGLTGAAQLLAFDPSGSRLAAMDKQRIAMVWDAGTGEALLTGVADHDEVPAFLRLINGGRSMLTAGRADGRIIIVEVESGEIDRVILHDLGPWTAFAMTSDARRFILADESLAMHVIDEDGGLERTIRSTRGQFNRLAVGDRPDLRREALTPILAAGTERGAIGLWNLETGEHEAWLDGAEGRIRALAVLEDGAAVAAVDDRGLGMLWVRDRASGRWSDRPRMHALGHSEVQRVVIAPRTTDDALADHDGGRPLLIIDSGSALHAWAIDPDARPTRSPFTPVFLRLEDTVAEDHRRTGATVRLAASANARWCAMATRLGPIRLAPIIDRPDPEPDEPETPDEADDADESATDDRRG